MKTALDSDDGEGNYDDEGSGEDETESSPNRRQDPTFRA